MTINFEALGEMLPKPTYKIRECACAIRKQFGVWEVTFDGYKYTFQTIDETFEFVAEMLDGVAQ